MGFKTELKSSLFTYESQHWKTDHCDDPEEFVLDALTASETGRAIHSFTPTGLWILFASVVSEVLLFSSP